MKREKIIQLLQFVVAWVLIWAFVHFVIDQSFVDFVLKYWLFFVIASVSYFYYYSIRYEVDKKYETIRSIVIWGNVYLFAHIFFRPLLNISHELFVLLGLIIVGVYGTTKMKSRRKGVLQIVGGVFSFFILISGIFYLYPDAPNIDGFLAARRYEIGFRGISAPVDKRDGYIQITNARKIEDFELSSNISKLLLENCKISYPSMKKNRDEKVVILGPGGDMLLLFPQSEIQIEFVNKNMMQISKLTGRVGFLSGMFGGDIRYEGDLEALSQENADFLSAMSQEYAEELVDFLREQISDSQIGLASSTIMQNIDGVILRFLARMFPTTFGQNLKNYNQFQQYFGLVEGEKESMSRYSTQKRSGGGGIKNIWQNLKRNMDSGKGGMYMF